MEQNTSLSLEDFLVSDRIKDTKYPLNSPEVTKWKDFFHNRAKIDDMFKGIRSHIEKKEKRTAAVIGSAWLSFNNMVPKFLLQSAVNVSDNLIRHYIIQVAFEELGGRKTDEIHSHLFRSMLNDIGLEDKVMLSISSLFGTDLLDQLYSDMENSKSDAETLGMSLGLEINAEENIEVLFEGLSYSKGIKSTLEDSLFFRMHRVVEEEHIRLNISNFLRFCPSEKEKELFTEGFDKSVKYWDKYWERNCLFLDTLKYKFD